MHLQPGDKYRAVQKIVKNGRSAQVTLTRPALYVMQLLPGDDVEVWVTEDGIGHFRPWESINAYRQRPIVATEKPASELPK